MFKTYRRLKVTIESSVIPFAVQNKELYTYNLSREFGLLLIEKNIQYIFTLEEEGIDQIGFIKTKKGIPLLSNKLCNFYPIKTF